MKPPSVHQQGDGNINTHKVNGDLTINQTTINNNASSPLQTENPSYFGVPSRNNNFTGREALLKDLHKRLHPETEPTTIQVQAISGFGGIGKTQIAIEYAHRYYHDQKVYNCVFWVLADTKSNLDARFADLADKLALLMPQATQQDKMRAVKNWLATHGNWLLIFDNADEPKFLNNLMPTNPQGKVLLTSRADVDFAQLNIVKPLKINKLPPNEAIDFLFNRTQYKRTDQACEQAEILNQELDGLPLALEQACAYMVASKNIIKFQEYLDLYKKQGLDLLEKGKAKTGDYSSTVRQTWFLNFDAVAKKNEAASHLLNLSAFLAPDQIPYSVLRNGAQYLGPLLEKALQHEEEIEFQSALVDLLKPLHRYSLIDWESEKSENHCYSVHRLVQAVVRDDMKPDTQMQWLERGIAATAAPNYDFDNWSTYKQLLPHWLSLIKQSKVNSEALVSISNQAGYYLAEQGEYKGAKLLLEKAYDLSKQLFGDEHPNVAQILNNLAELYRY